MLNPKGEIARISAERDRLNVLVINLRAERDRLNVLVINLRAERDRWREDAEIAMAERRRLWLERADAAEAKRAEAEAEAEAETWAAWQAHWLEEEAQYLQRAMVRRL